MTFAAEEPGQILSQDARGEKPNLEAPPKSSKVGISFGRNPNTSGFALDTFSRELQLLP
jgi:hypothetical protein